MTPAIKQLKKQNIPFEVLQYHHDTYETAFGHEAVEKLSLPAEQVFKTLVVCTDKDQLAVAIIPTHVKLDLKRCAKALKVKKVKMADAKRVETTSGYVLGGVSPLGQKKPLVTLIDSSAETLKVMYVSGGRRGLEIAISPYDLAQCCQAKWVAIST